MHGLVSFPDHHHQDWEWGSLLLVLYATQLVHILHYHTKYSSLSRWNNVECWISSMDAHSSECSLYLGCDWVETVICRCGLLYCSLLTRLTQVLLDFTKVKGDCWLKVVVRWSHKWDNIPTLNCHVLLWSSVLVTTVYGQRDSISPLPDRVYYIVVTWGTTET